MNKVEKRQQKLKAKVIDKAQLKNWEKDLLNSGFVKISKQTLNRLKSKPC